MTDEPPVRVLHINSLLSGGGTDDQCVKLAAALNQISGIHAALAGPVDSEFGRIAQGLSLPLHDTGRGCSKIRFIAQCAQLIRRNNIDIIHGHHGRDIWRTILAARLSRRHARTVLTRHMAKSPSSIISRKFLLKECDVLVAVSEFVRKILTEGHHDPTSPERERQHRPPISGDPRKIQVIYGGIDTARFFPTNERSMRATWGLTDNHYIFAVAGGYDLPRGKGQREFLKAAAQIHQRVPHARFLIIGRGSMRSILERDIADLGLTGKALLAPYCADMPAALNSIDCLVHPQIGTEAFALVVLEAFACGIPVIASALDGIPEAFRVGEAGQLVQPESIQKLATAMETQARIPNLSPPAKKDLWKKVDAVCSITSVAQNYARLYRSMIGTRR